MGSDETSGRGRGHGKLILFGEHAVVYGSPAVVGGLDQGAEATARAFDGRSSRVRVESGSTTSDEQRATVHEAFDAVVGAFGDALPGPVEVDVEIGIPVGVGLGSSAAFCAAVARAVADWADPGSEADDLVEEAVSAGESVFHGNPSGLDQAAALDGGLQFFRPGEPTEQASIEVDGCRFGVCVAGRPAATSEMVSKVAAFRERESELFEYIRLLIGDTVRFACGAMRDGDWERVGELMDINHGALTTIGVSTPELDRACHLARDAGALGAKLTGAGGGGCVVALLPEGEEGVLEAWDREGWECFDVEWGAR